MSLQALVLDDTIVAVSSEWRSALLGLVRVSGPGTFSLAHGVGAAAPPDFPRISRAELSLRYGAPLPAELYWFRAPHSYTGQDLVEIHTVGALPWLRALADHFVQRGARRALPGEFTSRAYLNGRIDALQVDAIYSLIHAESSADARRAAVVARGGGAARTAGVRERMLDLLALVEAGIDFVEEEDIVLVTPAQARRELGVLSVELDSLIASGREFRVRRPTVALVGRPNAGKSTLFNALLGRERAIVSPIIGSTRDVLTADLRIAGLDLTLQDCAGLGASSSELELAARRATESVAAQADLVLWVHDSRDDWRDEESADYLRIVPERRLLVLSKIDEPNAGALGLSSDAKAQRVSSVSGSGLADLRSAIAARLGELRSATSVMEIDANVHGARAAVQRATALCGEEPRIPAPELLAAELRAASELLLLSERGPLVDDVLGRIFGRFCIGK